MKKKLSPFLILCSAICFSSGGLFLKSIPWGPFAISGGRAIFAAIVIFIYMKLRHHKIVINKSVILCGVCLAASSYFWTIAGKLTSSAAAIILEYTAPVFIILYSLIFYRKKPAKLDIIIIPIIACGVVCFFFDSLMATSTAPNPLVGNLFGIAAGMTFAVVFMMKMLPGSDNLSSIFVGCLICSIVGLPMIVSDVMTPGHAEIKIFVMIFLMGTVQFATSYICMAEGLDYTPAFAASLISMAEPILNPLLTAAILYETVGIFTIVGSVVVIGSIVCYNLLTARKENQNTLSSKETS